MKKCQKKTFLRDKPTNKQVQCADPSHDYWIHFHVFPILYVAPTLKNVRVWWFQLYASLSDTREQPPLSFILCIFR